MSHVQDVSVELTPELITMLRAAVATGEYATISDALQTWRLQRTIPSAGTADLRVPWEQGIASEQSVEAEPVFKHLRDKYARQAADT